MTAVTVYMLWIANLTQRRSPDVSRSLLDTSSGCPCSFLFYDTTIELLTYLFVTRALCVLYSPVSHAHSELVEGTQGTIKE